MTAVTERDPTRTDARLAFSHALRDIAGAVDADPDFPVPVYPTISVNIRGANDATEAAEVFRAAAAMGVEPVWNDENTHLSADRQFGPVTYHVYMVTQFAMDRYHAETTYRGAVKP